MEPVPRGTGGTSGRDPHLALEELRATLDSIGEAVLAADLEARITRMNPAASRLLEWPEAEAVGRPLDEVLLVDARSPTRLENPARQILREGRTVELSGTVLTRDGGLRAIAGCGSPVVAATGTISGLVLVFRDQGADHARLQALQESEELHRTVAESTSDWEYLRAQDGRLLYMSPSCLHITGYDRQEFLTRPGLLEEIIHPDDRPRMEGHRPDQSGQEVEFRIVHRDGGVRWIGCVCQPAFRADGTPQGKRFSNRDITDRKRAEATLLEERRIFVGGPTVVFKWRAAEGWPVEYVSPNVQEQLGYRPEALLSGTPPFSALVHPDDLERVAREVTEHTLAGDPIFEQEYRLRRVNGEYRWLYDFTTVLRDAQGAVTHYLGYVQDITNRKQTEAALRQSEERYRQIVDTANEGIWVIDEHRRTTFVNARLASMLGFEAVEMQGRVLDSFIPEEELPDHLRRMASRQQGLAERYERQFRRKDGTTLWTSIAAAPRFDAERRFCGSFGMLTDITESKRAEAALRAAHERLSHIIDFLPDATFVIDRDKRVIAWNRAIEEMTGTRKADILGQGDYAYALPWYGERRPILIDLVDSDDADFRARYDYVHKQGDTLFAEVFVPSVFGGKGAHLWVTASPLLDAEGNRIGAIESVRDITERKRAEQERQEHIRFLEALERVDQAVRQANDASQLLWSIARETQATFQCDRTWLLYPCDPEAPSFRVPVEVTRPEYPGAKDLDVDIPVSPGEAQNLREALASNEPVTYTAGTDRPVTTAPQFGVQSQMFTALHPRLGPPWVFGMHQCSRPRVWTGEEKRLFKEIARRMSDGLSALLFLRELQENEERFRSTFEQAAVGLAHVAPDGHWLRVNQKLCDIVGYSQEELLQKTFQDITYPDDLDADLEYVHRMLAGDISTYSMEKRYVRKDGSLVWINLTVALVHDRAGQPANFISVVEDISERKRTEEAMRLANERFASVLRAATHLSIIATDPEGVIKVMNEGAQRMLGYRAEELVDRATPLRFHDPSEVAARAQELGLEPGFGVFVEKARQGETETREWTYVRRDGTRLTVALTIGARRSEDGVLTGFVGIGRDITVEKKLEQQLLQSQKMETVGLLAGGVAHDFNNLLTPIMSYAELLQLDLLPLENPQQEQPPGDNTVQGHIEEILRAARRARELVQQLLTLSRKQVVQLKPVNLGDIVRRCAAMLRRTIQESVSIEIRLPAALGLVRADAGQIEQILMNLSVNAQDAMPAGGVLAIEAADLELDQSYTARHPEAQPGPYVMLAVSDTGVGMDEATLARVFEPFFTTKPPGKGTGLGLSTVYGIVKQHQGSVCVYSEKGCGTTFKVFLPRAPDAGAVQPGQQAEQVVRGTETVLVVEDDEAVRGLACTLLRGLGYQVLSARGVEQCVALAEARTEPLHLLLTDVVMPGMNGRELYERLRRRRPGLKVLFMSGFTTNVIGHHGVLDEGVHLLQKPFTHSSLSTQLREALDAR